MDDESIERGSDESISDAEKKALAGKGRRRLVHGRRTTAQVDVSWRPAGEVVRLIRR